MLEEIKCELNRLKNIKKEIIETIKRSPTGKLRCATNKGYYQYYCGKEYLGKEKRDYAEQIAQKEYCLKLNRKVDIYQSALETLRSLYENEELEEIYRGLHPARKVLVEPLVKPIENVIEKFEAIKHEPKGFEEGDTTEYYTIKGERVRSKSEKIIADELYRYHIPYKYEFPITLVNRNKNVQFYPDFTALNRRTGKQWIIEHLGMMDKTSYCENALQKLDLYERNNFFLGNNLILLNQNIKIPVEHECCEKVY